jgi:hypothetical protein
MKHAARMRAVERWLSNGDLTDQMMAEQILALFHELDTGQLEIISGLDTPERVLAGGDVSKVRDLVKCVVHEIESDPHSRAVTCKFFRLPLPRCSDIRDGF